jgi:pyridoxine kinase
MVPYLQHWQQLGLSFDGVYTGFLGNAQQADHLESLLRRAAENGALRLVDPAMADHGRLYATCTPALVQAMGRLVALASVATPNLTEACLLTNTDYPTVLALPPAQRRQAVEAIGRQILERGCGAVVITGIPDGDCRLCNAVMDARETAWVCSERVRKNYAGTGDVFSSVLCGKLLQGVALKEAVEQTAAFVWQITAYTARLDSPEQDGIVFEPFLHDLTDEENEL